MPLPVLILGFVDVGTVFKQIQDAHNRMSGGVIFVRDGQSAALASGVMISKEKSRISMPSQRIVEITPNASRFYDAIFNQVATTKSDIKLDPVTGLISVASMHREPLGFILDGKIRNDFLKTLQSSKGWKIGAKKLYIEGSARTSSAVVEYDSSFRITRLKNVIGRKVIQDWTFGYSGTVPQIPANATVVPGLTQRPALPKSVRPSDIASCLKIWRAQSELRNNIISQQLDGAKFKAAIRPGELSETGPKGSWVAQNKILTIKPNGKPARQFSGKFSQYLDEIRKGGMEPSPFSRAILNRQVPFLDIFNNSLIVNGNGTISVKGRSMGMMTVTKMGAKVRLTFDRATGRISQLSTVRLNPNGKEVLGSKLSLSYQ